MLSNHKLQITLGEIKEISRIDLALFTDKGKLLAATYDLDVDMEEAIRRARCCPGAIFSKSLLSMNLSTSCWHVPAVRKLI